MILADKAWTARAWPESSGLRYQTLRLSATLCALLLATGLLCGCRRANTGSPAGSPSQAQAAPSPRTDFEEKLQYVRDGQFNHIYVFTRKDGGAFDRDDVEYLTANSPVGEKTNMRVKTDDGRRVVIGTNFEYTQENFDTLGKRFNIEDYTGR
ncbi:MAG TPA: hypothetical protein VF553_21230 [Pyrinomonadaceae bacterium]|jgi:hypothetical protein